MAAQQLTQIIAQTLAADANTIRNAEEQLRVSQKSPHHLLEILQLIANAAPTEDAIRQAAAVHFKNCVKVGWDVNREDGNDGITISEADRITIKTHLVELMGKMPSQIQVQISESISIVAKTDYPYNWENLLPELVQKFESDNPTVVLGVLKTANSIFKRFRYVRRSDDLYRVIIYSLQKIQEPLLRLFKKIDAEIGSKSNDFTQLRPRFEALRLLCRIVFSLNYQDLPEYFEDHMTEFMNVFAKYLQYQNPVLTDDTEELEPGPIDSLQTAIIHILVLHADKDEESFLPFLPNFTTLVWNLIMNATAYPKHDVLATTSIRFLSSLIKKPMHRELFNKEETLREIVLRVVIPNLKFRESDEERFEDDPRDYIVTEVEGSDSESRRKCSEDLLRAMCRLFEAETTAICSEHVGSMLANYGSDPNSNWAAKDAAIHLMMGIAIRLESLSGGVSEVNESVNVMDFFRSQILPELQDSNHSSRPVVKATSIKFVGVFRNQFNKESLIQLLPLLIAHLGSSIVVVHTFSAYTIERILCVKENQEDRRFAPFLITKAELKGFLEPLFNALFLIIDNVSQNENDYVMKCVMRSLATAGEDVIPVTEIVVTKLTAALGRVAKNPRNPQYNHYLFESIAVLVRSVCSKNPNATARFETLLFEQFNLILSADVAEFTPYVFQILAQLLECRPGDSGLGDGFGSLFEPLLGKAPWEKRGNVPALGRLMHAYIRKASTELVPRLTPILGVFQFLHMAKATEVTSYEILTTATIHFPRQSMEPHFGQIFNLVLYRLQNSRTPRYTNLATTYFAVFIGKFGAQVFLDLLNRVQNGLPLMILAQIWNPRIVDKPPSKRVEMKSHVIGLTKLLTDATIFLGDDNAKKIWSETLAALVSWLNSESEKKVEYNMEEEVEIGYDNQFSELRFAAKPPEDPFPEIADSSILFVQSLHHLLSNQPAALTLVRQQLPELATGLELMFRKAGLNAV